MKFRENPNSEERKAWISERQKKFTAMTPEEKKEYLSNTRSEMSQAFSGYCSASLPDKKTEICESDLFKRMYGPKPTLSKTAPVQDQARLRHHGPDLVHAEGARAERRVGQDHESCSESHSM